MASPKQTFPLFGYERFFAMTPDTCAKLAFVLTVRGDITALADVMPRAVVRTFNQHAKMRTLLLPGVAPQKVMVCPQLVDVAELHDNIFSLSWREHEEASTEWMAYVEHECEQPLNREQDWPYSVRVFADQTTKTFARIVVLADHYMADATSGAIVLDALLQNAAAVSSSVTCELTVQEPPLPQSLYECMHNTSAWMGVLHEAVAKWVLEPMFHFDHAGFTPVLPVATATQRDFAGVPPSPANPSKARFAEGTAVNMQRALQRCEHERVSLESATTAAMLLAFGLTKYHGNLRAIGEGGGEKLTMKADVYFDLRAQYPQTIGDNAVGLYTTTGNLVFTASEGASVSDHFWDVARRIDDERRETREGHELRLQSTYVHETLHAGHTDSSLTVQNCVLSDATLSSASLYPYAHELTLSKPNSTATTALEVASFHVYNSLPSLSSACMVFVSGVTSFNYAMMDKLEPEAAHELFHWFVQTMEHLGEVGEDDSLLQVSEKLERPLEKDNAVVAPTTGHPNQVAV